MRIAECKNLKSMEPTFRKLLVEPWSILSDPPTEPRVDHWQRRTKLGFNLFEEVGSMTRKAIVCPMCSNRIGVGASMVSVQALHKILQ